MSLSYAEASESRREWAGMRLFFWLSPSSCLFFCLDTKEPKSQDGTYYPHVPSEALMFLFYYCGERLLCLHEHPLISVPHILLAFIIA